MLDFRPSYLDISKERLSQIRDEMLASLKECRICPRACKVNRLEDELGFCKTARLAKVSSFNLHFGEENVLVGRGGSGTIFFSFCNLGCIYCQNHTISHSGEGRLTDAKDLASIMLGLQDLGAENINFVTPTHVVTQILEALVEARERGLRLPLVYNSGGYDSDSVLRRLKPVFDIYMPDIKYSDNQAADRYSSAPDYWDVCQKAVLEMHRQVGDLQIDERGVAQKGLLIRHLVLPNRIGGSHKIIDFIAANISENTYLNIMDQYRPCHKAYMHPELMRRITQQEYNEVVEYARKKGLQSGFA